MLCPASGQDVLRVIDEILRIAKPGGKIVLADFNSRGFAIMNEVHRHEQRIHARFPCRFMCSTNDALPFKKNL